MELILIVVLVVIFVRDPCSFRVLRAMGHFPFRPGLRLEILERVPCRSRFRLFPNMPDEPNSPQLRLINLSFVPNGPDINSVATAFVCFMASLATPIANTLIAEPFAFAATSFPLAFSAALARSRFHRAVGDRLLQGRLIRGVGLVPVALPELALPPWFPRASSSSQRYTACCSSWRKRSSAG